VAEIKKAQRTQGFILLPLGLYFFDADYVGCISINHQLPTINYNLSISAFTNSISVLMCAGEKSNFKPAAA
jgi:hypothetical protein